MPVPFRLDFDVFANVVKNADTDVIEAESLLDVTNNLQQHLFRVFAGDGSFGDAVQKAKLTERRCSSANSVLFSTATDTWPAAVWITSRSRCSRHIRAPHSSLP